MTPGIGTLRLIWANLFYSEEKRNGLLNILPNRHLVFEKYQYYALIDLMAGECSTARFCALQTHHDDRAVHRPPRPRHRIARRIRNDDIDALMGKRFEKYV